MRYIPVLAAMWMVQTASLQANDSVVAVRSLVGEWSRASKECRSLDATLTEYALDVFDPAPRSRNGRFRYERSGNFRCQIDGTYSVSRRDDAVTLIDFRDRTYRQFDLNDVAAKRLELARLHANDPISRMIGKVRWAMLDADVESSRLPFLLFDDEDFLTRYVLERFSSADGVRLKAIRAVSNSLNHREIWFYFRPDAALPSAVRYVYGKHGYRTLVLENVQLNIIPPDRDVFMDPDLSQLGRR